MKFSIAKLLLLLAFIALWFYSDFALDYISVKPDTAALESRLASRFKIVKQRLSTPKDKMELIASGMEKKQLMNQMKAIVMSKPPSQRAESIKALFGEPDQVLDAGKTNLPPLMPGPVIMEKEKKEPRDFFLVYRLFDEEELLFRVEQNVVTLAEWKTDEIDSL